MEQNINRPIIGMPTIYSAEDGAYIPNGIVAKAIQDAGGEVLPMPTDQEHPLPCIDGLVVPGGKDVDPAMYGEDPVPETTGYMRSDDEIEASIIRRCAKVGIPILTICRGTQLLNVAFGGNLWQDILSQVKDSKDHRWNGCDKSLPAHEVTVTGKILSSLFGKDSIDVNSRHHQAVRNPGNGLTVAAVSDDGIIEALEGENILSVQWHPENIPGQQVIFEWLVKKSIAYSQTKQKNS